MNVKLTAEAARKAARVVAQAPTERKNRALTAMAERLESRADDIVAANDKDMRAARDGGVADNMVKRLSFGRDKIASRVSSLRTIAGLPDPVGEVFWRRRLENGLEATRVRVPLGVILMIYEARPHVSVNAGAFCLKSGNAAILRGGSEARICNELLGQLWRESLVEAGLPAEAIQLVGGSHADVDELLTMSDSIDLVIPRGGKRLIESVHQKSKIPVVKHFAGVCHVYVDSPADIDKAIPIIIDSKCLMPAVCNTAETLLVARGQAAQLPRIVAALRDAGVKVKGCEETRRAVADVEPATDEDWTTEYLDLIISVRVVADVEEAVEHINTYGSHHTDTIVTSDPDSAEAFRRTVDSGVVLTNASTMFCDGASLGMGAEIGISTDKLHARGPMGLEELTSYKFVIAGDGQIMGA
ncbi:MAG: glutamate-5-semialdehyde dehydrogenase [Chitinivibrionales bacterium]|nr:glutamate-5-semialdehyde dehydrogenase [Chitinivibrionales bacterium]